MKTRPAMLSATFVRNVNVPGRYGDGRGGLGLSLLVKPASRGGISKSWSQSVRFDGRPTSSASAATRLSPSPWPAAERWTTPAPSLRDHDPRRPAGGSPPSPTRPRR